MNWSSLAGKMAEIGLPALGGLFGGPMGSTLGGLAERPWPGAGVDPTPEAVAERIDANPNEAAVKLAQIEAETKRTEAEFADMANARAQTIALAQSGSSIAWGAPVVSVVVVVGFFTMAALLMYFAKSDIPPNVFAMFNVVFGVMAAGFAQVTNYWLGNSEGARRNADRLAQVTNAALAPSPAPVAPVKPGSRR